MNRATPKFRHVPISAGWLRPSTKIIGRYVDGEGYVRVKVQDHYLVGTSRILEHRLVMSEKLGRVLLSSELVHHKNQDRSARHINHPDGLEVLDISNHSKLHKLGRKFSEKHRAALSQSKLGNKDSLGRRQTAKTKLTLSLIMRGNRRALGNKSRLGQPHIEKTKQRISIAMRARAARISQETTQ